MTATSAREYRDLLVTMLFRICADHDFVSRQADRAWMKDCQSSQHFFHHIFRMVNELFHDEANVQRKLQPYFM
jgi:hypothetical protein